MCFTLGKRHKGARHHHFNAVQRETLVSTNRYSRRLSLTLLTARLIRIRDLVIRRQVASYSNRVLDERSAVTRRFYNISHGIAFLLLANFLYSVFVREILTMGIRRGECVSSIHLHTSWLLLMVQTLTIVAGQSAGEHGMASNADARGLSISNNAWMPGKVNPGKDQLNAAHLRNSRMDMMKSVFIAVGLIVIVVVVGGVVGMLVHYVKQRKLASR